MHLPYLEAGGEVVQGERREGGGGRGGNFLLILFQDLPPMAIQMHSFIHIMTKPYIAAKINSYPTSPFSLSQSFPTHRCIYFLCNKRGWTITKPLILTLGFNYH